MFKVIAKRMRNQKGFTLVELLVVVAIIAILAAVLLPQLMGYTTRARESRAMSDLATIRSIVEAYAADEGKGSYPAPDNTADGGIAKVLQAHGVKWTGGTDGIRDPWGSPYYYAAPKSGNNYLSFIVLSPGADKTAGNADDIYCTDSQAPTKGDPTAVTDANGNTLYTNPVASAQ